MTRLDWLELWDELRAKLNERTSWGRIQILEEMGKLEREKVRKIAVRQEKESKAE